MSSSPYPVVKAWRAKNKDKVAAQNRTGSFRGWLCDRCNRTLGQVKDDVGLLSKMISYLTQGGANVRSHGSAA